MLLLLASPCTLRLAAVAAVAAAAAALIWRFSFEIIRSEKSPTAASTPNRDADTVENICCGLVQGAFDSERVLERYFTYFTYYVVTPTDCE